MNGGGFVGLGCVYSGQISSLNGARQKIGHFQCIELKIAYKILNLRSVHNTMKLVLLFCNFFSFFPMTYIGLWHCQVNPRLVKLP